MTGGPQSGPQNGSGGGIPAGPADAAARVARVRQHYAREVTTRAGVSDARVEAAFAAVPRERFLGPGPWRLLARDGGVLLQDPAPADAYHDALFALDPAQGVNNGSPSLHALMLHALDVRPGARVVHVGAGSGYYTALLAELAGPDGRVSAVEFDPALAERARANLADRPGVEVVHGDGAAWPRGEADRVYVNFACSAPAPPWVERLAPDGRLVLPLGAGPPHGEHGATFVFRRVEAGYEARLLAQTSFIHARGERLDPAADAALHAAFGAGGAERVASLRWREAADPARCWFRGAGWALCYDPPSA